MAEFERWLLTPQTPLQPGELVLGCGHTARQPISDQRPDPANRWTWFELAAPMVVSSPRSAAPIESRWLVACRACLRAADGDPKRVTIREHWKAPATTSDHLARLRQIGDDPGKVGAYLEQLGDEDLQLVAARLFELRQLGANGHHLTPRALGRLVKSAGK